MVGVTARGSRSVGYYSPKYVTMYEINMRQNVKTRHFYIKLSILINLISLENWKVSKTKIDLEK